jgi:hypothetical protein
MLRRMKDLFVISTSMAQDGLRPQPVLSRKVMLLNDVSEALK